MYGGANLLDWIALKANDPRLTISRAAIGATSTVPLFYHSLSDSLLSTYLDHSFWPVPGLGRTEYNHFPDLVANGVLSRDPQSDTIALRRGGGDEAEFNIQLCLLITCANRAN